MKDYIEVTLKKDIDPFVVNAHLKKYSDIRSYIVSHNTIRIWYNPKRLELKMLMKVIAQATSKDHRSRKANVLSIREVKED